MAVRLPVDKLCPHPLNERIYGTAINEALREDIATNGILEPIVIWYQPLGPPHPIISGHQRWMIAKELGLKEVLCESISTFMSRDMEATLISFNKYRVKTHEMIAREFIEMERIEEKRREQEKREKAREQTKTQTRDEGGKFGSSRMVMKSSPSGGEPPKSRDVAAKQLGIGHQKATRAKQVVQAIDKLREEGQTDKAEELRTVLNTKSVDAAFKKATGKQTIKRVKPTHDKQTITLPRELEAMAKALIKLLSCDDIAAMILLLKGGKDNAHA